MFYDTVMKDLKILLGKRIKELRNKRGFSQQELAEMVNIDQRSLSSIECGNTFPSKSLLQLSKALNVEPNELFEFDSVRLGISEMKKYIVSNLDNLEKNDIKKVYYLIKSML